MAGIGEVFLNSIRQPSETPSTNVSGEGLSQLASMKNGDTFSAKVVKSDGSDVTLRLPGGNLVNAKLSSDMSISEGQNVTFQVKSNASSISISPLLTNTATDVSVLKALNQASLPVTNESAGMVSEMMKAGLPIDRSSLLGMYEKIMSNPGAPVSDIVDLSRLGLEVNGENLNNIGNYKNLSYQIDQGMQEIAEKTDQALMDMLKSGDSGNAARLMNSVIETALSYIDETGDPLSESLKDVTNSADASPAADAGAVEGDGNAKENTEISASVQPDGSASGSGKTDSSVTQALQGDVSSSNDSQAVNVQHENDPAARALELLKALQNAESTDASPTDMKSSQAAGENALQQDASAVTRTLSDAGAMTTREAFDSSVSVMKELTGNPDYAPSGVKELLDDVNAFAQKALQSSDRSGLGKLLSSDAFRKLTFDVLKDQWSISPSEVSDKDKVESLYKRLENQLSMLKDGLANAGAQNTPAFNSANNMSSNIDFLQQINQMYAYIQLPLKLSDGDSAHGDLYVFSNRKNMSSDDSVVTAFLHLDMDNLGPVDVYVSMDVASGGKVSTNFTVADDETLDLLNDHMDMLTERLKGRGYDVSCSMKLKSDEPEPEEDALKNGGVNLLLVHAGSGPGSFSPGMRSFDVRA